MSNIESTPPKSSGDPQGLFYKSVFSVPQMDCPSEEFMIRNALDGLGDSEVGELNIPERKAVILHGGNLRDVEKAMSSLGLGAVLIESNSLGTDELKNIELKRSSSKQQTKLLSLLLGINALVFVIELIVGIRANSTGLIADSLDMLVDATVYGIALFAVGKSGSAKVRAAHYSGYMQGLLALGVLLEVFRRLIFGSAPESTLMFGMGVLALAANVTCLVLISKSKNDGAHMKASWIFSANDVLANVGVLIAAGLVALTGSRFPDLLVGLVISTLIFWGAIRILRLK